MRRQASKARLTAVSSFKERDVTAAVGILSRAACLEAVRIRQGFDNVKKECSTTIKWSPRQKEVE